MSKIVFIGLDGVPHSFILDAVEKGILKNLGGILSDGKLYKIKSSIPEISSVAWSSLITGKSPGEHGIFGFTELAPNSYTMTFPNFNNIKSAPFWLNEDFSLRKDKRFAIINTPFTFPASEINGVHISGFVALDLKDAVFPESLFKQLDEMKYKIDVDSYLAHESINPFLRDLDKTLTKRIEASKEIFHNEDWDVFMLVFTGTDRLSHFLWDAYVDEGHKHHSDFLSHFQKIDQYVGEIFGELGEDDTIAFVSDHGFEALKLEVFINRYLHEWGYLKFRNDPARSYNDIDAGTKAFAMDPGRIYLNYKDRYPRGNVTKDDAAEIIESLREKFTSLRIDGKKVIDEIFLGNDVYHGQYKSIGPDLILLGASGFDLKGNIKSQEFYVKGIFNGKHTYYDAFFGVRFPDSYKDNPGRYPEVESVEDIRKVLEL